MDKKLLDFLRETLTPEQSELMEIAEGLADCCEEDPSIPAGSIQLINALCSHFPRLVKRGDIPPVPDPPPPDAPTREDTDRILRASYMPPGEDSEEQENLARANKRTASLLNIKRCLEKQLLELNGEKARLDIQKEQAEDRTKKATAMLAVQTEKFNEMVSTLVSQVDELNKRIRPGGDGPPIFFSQLPMEEFLEAQESYTVELNNFCKASFSKDLKELRELTPEAIADMFSGGRQGQEARIDPRILQVQSMKSLGLMKRIRVQLEADKFKSHKERLMDWEEKVKKLKEEGDEEAVGILTLATQQELMRTEEQFREDCKGIPKQVEDIAMSEIRQVLSKEMEHKLAQQKEMASRQEELIHYLKYQRTMYVLVSQIYEAEKRKMGELLECLETMKSVFEETRETARLLEENSREARDSDAHAPTEDTPRLIIPSSDRSLNRLYKLMGLEHKSRFPTYEVLREAISNLQHKIGLAHERSECIKKANLAVALHTELNLEKATESINEFEDQRKQLVDGPEGKRQLEERLQEFEHKMKEVLQTVNSHKQELVQHPTLALERKMAAVYHTDPQLYTQLKHKLESIKANLK